VPPSGLNPNSRIFCKIHYRAAGSFARSTTEHLQAPAQKNDWAAVGLQSGGVFGLVHATRGRVELHKTAFLRHKPFCVSQMQRKSSSPLRKTTRFSHYGKNASFLKGSQYPQRTGARD